MISLTDGVSTVELPEDIEWVDEHSWSPVSQSQDWSLTGAQIIDVGVRQAGRPITLQSNEDQSIISAASLAQLKGWAAVPGKNLSLVLRGLARQVVFRHQDGAIEAQPVGYWRDNEMGQAVFFITLRFSEV